MYKQISFFAIWFFVNGFLINSSKAQTTYEIRLNQVGYLPNAIKYAAVVGPGSDQFEIRTADMGSTVHSGTLGKEVSFLSSDEVIRIADFTVFKTPGEYVLYVEGLGASVPFTIDRDVFVPISRASIKAFYYNRASTALLAENAGIYSRAAGHPDDQVVVHPSAASAERPAGTKISTPYGWYDAGDYNKYIVNSGISTFTLLSAYETYPDYYDTLTWNIPESGNEIPDLLDEALWNIKWMMSMQDTVDGGVYNKTTTANFEGFVMPASATSTRYVVAKGTAATLDFAAIMAMTARIYKDYLPGLAAEALEKAKNAWAWAKANPNVPFNNPAASQGYPAVGTGGYGDGSFADEFAWCATELYITTGEDSYYSDIVLDNNQYDIPGWGNVRTLGLVSLLLNRKNLTALADTALAKQKLLDLIEPSKNNTNTTAYRVPAESFGWGSNSSYANRGMLLMQAFKITGDAGYFNAAIATFDYLLGKNATTYCFVTGFGTKNPKNIHHRPSGSDGIAEPIPGFIAGGPNPGNVDDDCGASQYPSTLPAKAYVDKQCSYSTNEIAINWNAPLAFLSGAIQYEYLKNFTDSMSVYFIKSTGEINLPYLAGSEMELVLSTNLQWSASSTAAWIGLSQNTGNGTATVKVSANEDNPGESEREAFVYISSDGIVIDSVYITQNGKRKSFAVEAEDFSDMLGLQTESTTDLGEGLNIGYVDIDDWVEYNIDISYEGVYGVVFRHAGLACNFDVHVDGEPVKNISLPATAGWQVWADGDAEIGFTEGAHILKFLFKAAGLNLNRMSFTWLRELDAINISRLNKQKIHIYPVPAHGLTNIVNENGPIDKLQITSTDGKIVYEDGHIATSNVVLDFSSYQPGLYVVSITQGGRIYKKMLVIE